MPAKTFKFIVYWYCLQCFELTSVLWRCWLGGRKGIRPVKNRVLGCWRGYLSGTRWRLAYGLANATATHCLLLHLNPDWFCLLVPDRLTWAVPDKGPLNVCVCIKAYPTINSDNSVAYYSANTLPITDTAHGRAHTANHNMQHHQY